MPKATPYAQGFGQEVPFGSFEPDSDPTKPGILLDMQNAQPTVKGFRAMPSPVAIGTALPAASNGSIEAFYSDGSSSLIAGTGSHLYRYVSGVPVQYDGGNVFAVQSRWRFFQFGDDVIATAIGTLPFVASGATGSFSFLGGSPPANAVTGCSVLGTAFLFVGQTWNASAAGVDNNWTPNVQNLAANGSFYDIPGPVVAAVPFYGNVIVFKQNSVWLMSFAGPPNSWATQLISDMTGTWNQECVIPLADQVIFIGSDDFYTTSGSVPTRIPNRCAEWFFNNVNQTFIGSTYGFYDESNGTAYWHFVSKAALYSAIPDLFISYNLRARRWGTGHLNVTGVPYSPVNSPIGAHTYFDINSVPQQLSGPKGPMFLTTGYMGDTDRLTKLLRWRPKFALGTPAGPGYPSAQNLAVFQVNQTGHVPVPQSDGGGAERQSGLVRRQKHRSLSPGVARHLGRLRGRLVHLRGARCGHQMITTVNNYAPPKPPTMTGNFRSDTEAQIDYFNRVLWPYQFNWLVALAGAFNTGSQGQGADIVSASTINFTSFAHRVTGTATITTINVPPTNFAGLLLLLSVGGFSLGAGGNINLGGTQAVSAGEFASLFYSQPDELWYLGL